MDELNLKNKSIDGNNVIKIESFNITSSITLSINEPNKKIISKSVNPITSQETINQNDENDNAFKNHSSYINTKIKPLYIDKDKDLSFSEQRIINENKNNKNLSSSDFEIPKNIKNSFNPSNSNNSNKHSVSHNSSSRQRNKLIFFDLNSLFNSSNRNIDEEVKKEMNKVCLICEENLTDDELINNHVECLHGFCDSCYYEYFKNKINNNEVERIRCPYKSCVYIIFNDFIEKKLINDIPLLAKYKKFLAKKQLMLNPNIQMCPYPDCESYAKKENNNKYVSCLENGHKFCFNCLKDWHDNKKCKIEMDKSFEKWKDPSQVKRCPKCKYFIQKYEGCNHMTCCYCKYQFCWLCMQEYTDGHFDLRGKCFGLQYCKCCSNRFLIFLYQLFIFLVKNILFAIAGSFFVFFVIYYKINDNFNLNNNCCANCWSYCSVILLSISLSTFLISISTFISILMTIIFPFHYVIFGFLEDII